MRHEEPKVEVYSSRSRQRGREKEVRRRNPLSKNRRAGEPPGGKNPPTREKWQGSTGLPNGQPHVGQILGNQWNVTCNAARRTS